METGLYYYGYRYYTPKLGRWINRDQIGEKGGINLSSFVSNASINWVDILGKTLYDLFLKQNGRQVPKAVGVTGGALFCVKVPGPFAGLFSGIRGALIFFPDSCDVAEYSVSAGLGNAIIEGRQPDREDFGKDYEAVYEKTFGGGIEMARYVGDATPGNANSKAFEGIFHTALTSTLYVDLSFYIGDESWLTGGNWIGGTITKGKGKAYGFVNWNYKKLSSYKLDDESHGKTTSLLGRCFCEELTKHLPGYAFFDIVPNARIVKREIYKIEKIDPITGEVKSSKGIYEGGVEVERYYEMPDDPNPSF